MACFHALFLCLAVTACVILGGKGHVRFVCPRPASARSDISFTNQSTGYCGVNMSEGYEREHLDVRPGLLTLRFEETMFHRNSPFRVSLHSVDSEESCLLLDHIPHNNHILLTDHCIKNGNTYPLGNCDKSTYYITVKIPDIDCDRCYLQLSHIVIDCTKACDLNNGSYSGFVSCAGIKIRPSPAGYSKNLSHCVRYEDNLAGDWPFRPMQYYTVDLVVGNDRVDPMLIFDAAHRTVHFDIPRFGFPKAMSSVHVSVNESDVWSVVVKDEQRLPDTVALVWKGVDDNSIQHLQNEAMVLKINCSNDWYIGNITLHVENYTEGLYHKAETADYTSDGWLADYRFRGIYAEDLTPVTPAGPCTETPRYFISYLHPIWKSDVFMHGILVASLVGDYADITVVLFNMQDKVKDITIVGSQLVGAPDVKLPVKRFKDNVLQISVDISTQVPFIDTVQFLKKVKLDTKWPALSLSGNFEEGIYCILRVGREVRGVAAFQFTRGQWLKYELLILSIGSNVTSMYLTGDYGLSYSLNERALEHDPSFYLVEGIIQDLNSNLLLQLWQGKLMMTVHTTDTIMHGMVTAPGTVYCKEVKDFACFWMDITLQGQPNTQGQKTVPPSGKAVFLLDSAHALQYSIEVTHMEREEEEVEAVVRDGEDLVFTVKLRRDAHHPTTFHDTNHVRVDSVMRKRLVSGAMKLEVFPVATRPTPLQGFLPPVKEHLCVQPKEREIGAHRGFWSPEAAPFEELFTIVGDSLVFKYSGNVSLFSYQSKEDMETCNFSLAKQLGPESVNGSDVTFYLRLNHVQTLYLTSQGHCNDTPSLQLTVHVYMPVPPLVGTTTDKCGTLVFWNWHEDQLGSFVSPEPTGAAIAGVVLGMLIALAFFFWDRRIQQKAELAIPGARFQRF